MRRIPDTETGVTEWIPVLSDPYRVVEKYFVTMKFSNPHSAK
jgi:hypothetical protein